MAELQQVTGNEFALARLSDGSRVLIKGTANSVVLPESTVRLIAHTHPGLQVAPSYADLTTLQALQQRWSLIISENNSWFKFFADWLEE
jgi:proteasome lid subunit RPN8/RPN11